MHNLLTLCGAPGATRYRELVASNYRAPAWELTALSEDGTILLDLTPYLCRFEGSYSDETISRQATFVIANPGGLFDRYKGGGVTQTLLENRILRFRKGLKDPMNGTMYLLPAFWGRIISARPGYSSGGDMVVHVTVGDALKNPIRNKITSPPYENTEVNLIAADLLSRFGKFTPDRLNLTAISKTYPFVQFPDYGLADALRALYDPLLFWVRADEGGRIATGPRLGSPLSSASGILGYPDQLSAPDPAAVAHVFPDDPGVESIEAGWQDFDGVYNQVRVLGRSVAAQQELGPNRLLFVQQDSSVAAKDKSKQRWPFSQDGSSTSNAVVAKNVFVEFNYSTNHTLDTTPHTAILSLVKWRSLWQSEANYVIGEAVRYGNRNYACSQSADGTHPPTDPLYWEEIPYEGPFKEEIKINNEDPRRVGYVKLESVVSSYLILSIEGRQYSVGNPYPRKYGGFDYNFKIYGEPVLAHTRTLTAYADYNPSAVIGETLLDVFGDHQTYQASHSPLGLGTPVEAYLAGVSQGKISADGSEISGEANFSVDFEKGRIVLNDTSYRDFAQDEDGNGAGQHVFSSGGAAHSTTQVFDLDQIAVKTPQEIYQTYRENKSIFTFPGLQVGQGYDLRLHFADPVNTAVKKRLFTVYAQGAKVIEGLDIVAKTGGAFIAYQETITGVGPDVSGVITVIVTQHDPVSGNLLPECSLSSDGTGGGGGGGSGEAVGTELICGIEVILPQGQGASPLPVNCGGPALSPTPPTITANYGFSTVQQTYGAQTLEINDPLIATQAECALVAGYWVNYSTWKRHPHQLRAASVPHIQPGDLAQWFNPKLSMDFWGYVYEIGRSYAPGAADADQYSCYLLYAQSR